MIYKTTETKFYTVSILLASIFIAILFYEKQWLDGQNKFAERLNEISQHNTASALTARSLPEPSLNKSLHDYQETVSMPLFSNTRSAFIPKPPPPRQQIPSNMIGKFELTGVIITSTIRMAILKHEITRKEKTVSIGQFINNWEIVGVEEKGVIIKQGNRIQKIQSKTQQKRSYQAPQSTKPDFFH